MRTKTLALTALLGALSSAAVMAQNVYSINAVGYVQVTVPANSYSILTDPLTNGVSNAISNVVNNSTGAYNKAIVSFFTPAGGYVIDDALPYSSAGGKGKTTNPDGWSANGVEVANPGVGFWFQNTSSSPMTITFVGSVPTGTLTQTIAGPAMYNLIGSIVPVYGDLQTTAPLLLDNYHINDILYMYDPVSTYNTGGGSIGGIYDALPTSGKAHGVPGTYNNNWSPTDATTYTPTQGFWYYNSGASITWTETFSIN
jgi:hypothetical protein